jgi:hypothetical protein
MKHIACWIFGHQPEAVAIHSVFETTIDALYRHKCGRCNCQVDPITRKQVDWKPFD